MLRHPFEMCLRASNNEYGENEKRKKVKKNVQFLKKKIRKPDFFFNNSGLREGPLPFGLCLEEPIINTNQQTNKQKTSLNLIFPCMCAPNCQLYDKKLL